MEMQETIKMAAAVRAFALSREFEAAADAATVASWGGEQVWLEVLPGGECRLISGTLGNLYDPPGALIAIPPLVESEWEREPRFYEDVRFAFLSKAEEALYA